MTPWLTTAVAALTLGAAFAAPAGAQETRTLTVGFDGSYPPFASVGPDGNLVGFEVDLINAVCAEIKAECTLENVPYDGIFAALEADRIDVIAAGLNITDERKQKYLMPGPFLMGPLAFVVPAGSDLQATPEGLSGKTIGTVGGSVFETYLNEKASGATVRTYDSMDAAVLDLDSGRLDAVLGEEPQLLVSYVQPKPDAYAIAGSVTEAAYMGQGKGIVVRKDEEALAAEINAAIDNLIANGTQASLTEKWFGKALPAR